MEFIKKHIYAIIACIATVLAVFACMTIEEINFPDNPKANSDIVITVKVKLVTETDDISKMAFAVLAPKSWNLASNAQLSLTTNGYSTQGFSEVTDEKMILMSTTDHEPTTDLTWPQAYQSKIGVMGNTGPVEWTVFRSQTTFTINDKVSKEPIYGTVTIRLKTGPSNIKFFMGFGFCGMHYGLNNGGEGRYKPNETAKILTVTGGTGSFDYTVLNYVSTVPSEFRYGDIFSVNFVSEVSNTPTKLKGVDKVYLGGRVLLADGTSKEVDTPSEATLMTKTGDISYMKYIYPKSFFNLPKNAIIKDLHVWFTNADKSIIVTNGTTGFEVAQSEE